MTVETGTIITTVIMVEEEEEVLHLGVEGEVVEVWHEEHRLREELHEELQEVLQEVLLREALPQEVLLGELEEEDAEVQPQIDEAFLPMKTKTTVRFALMLQYIPFQISFDSVSDKPGFDQNGGGDAIPNCQCEGEELAAVERTVGKEGSTKGKKFYTCSKGKDNGCGFFQWSEGDEGGGGAGRQAPQRRPPTNQSYGNVRYFSPFA